MQSLIIKFCGGHAGMAAWHASFSTLFLLSLSDNEFILNVDGDMLNFLYKLGLESSLFYLFLTLKCYIWTTYPILTITDLSPFGYLYLH